MTAERTKVHASTERKTEDTGLNIQTGSSIKRTPSETLDKDHISDSSHTLSTINGMQNGGQKLSD